MIEIRALISDIEETKRKIESVGGILKSNYAFKDIIFLPRTTNVDLNKDFLRLRVLSKNNWPTKDVILMRKHTVFKKIGKTDNIILRKEFDTEKEAMDFIKKEFSDFEFGFKYLREGWQYELDGHRVFIEDIKEFRPSIEIEADSEEKLKELVQKTGAGELLKESIPEIMRNILDNK